MRLFQLTNRLLKLGEERYSKVANSQVRKMFLRRDFVLLVT
jgi:hypothetical protein